MEFKQTALIFKTFFINNYGKDRAEHVEPKVLVSL